MTKPGRTHGATPDGRAMTTSRPDVSRRSFLKRSGATALGVSAASLLAACGHTTQRSSNTSAGSSSGSNAGAGTLGDGKTLRVGMEVAYAPYNWPTSEASDHTIPIQGADGQYADGYDVQFAKVIASALGMEPVAVKTSFTSLISSLNKGRIDIILAGMTATDERRQAIDFSDPYFVGRFGLLVRGDSPYAGATSLSDFRGAAVLGQEDTLLDTVIDEIEGVNHLTPVPSVPDQISQLLQGACDAISRADLLIIGGTSLAVYPAAGFAANYRGKLVIINRSPTPMDARADLLISAPIGQTMKAVMACLEEDQTTNS
jgi:ABC-type amino acid transport substrate-binding protein